MLLREGKACQSGISDTSLLEDLPVHVEAPESFVQPVQHRAREYTGPCNVAKVKVCIEAADHVPGDEALDHRYPHLAPNP